MCPDRGEKSKLSLCGTGPVRHDHFFSLFLSVDVNCENAWPLWLASYAFSTHVNIIHGDCIWTTLGTAIPDFWNPAIIFVLRYYMVAPACQLIGSPKKKSTQSSRGWLDYHELLPRFVLYPCVLNGLVKNIEDRCEDLGLQPENVPQPIQVLLEDISSQNYREDLILWIKSWWRQLPGPTW